MTPLYHATQQLPLFPTKLCLDCDPPTEKFLYEFYTTKFGGTLSCCKECKRKKLRAYNEAHRNELRKKNLANHHARREHYAQKSREYRETHKEQMKAYPTWREIDPLGYAEYMRRRYALKKAVAVGEVSYERILERDGLWCYICEQNILSHHKIDFDHVIPLSRNGPHSEDNIKPTHRVCNQRKHDRLLEEMTPYQRRGV